MNTDCRICKYRANKDCGMKDVMSKEYYEDYFVKGYGNCAYLDSVYELNGTIRLERRGRYE